MLEPLVPHCDEPPPDGVCQLAPPNASDVSTLPAAWFPSTNRMVPLTSNLYGGELVPIPILPAELITKRSRLASPSTILKRPVEPEFIKYVFAPPVVLVR